MLATSLALILLKPEAVLCVGNADDADGLNNGVLSSKRTLVLESDGAVENGDARVEAVVVLAVLVGSCPNVCTLVVTGDIVDVGAGIAEVITDDDTGVDIGDCDIESAVDCCE